MLRIRSAHLTRRAVLGAAALGVVLAGCGGAGSSGEAGKAPQQILQDVAAAVRSVHSFHLHGSTGSNSGPVTLDLRIANASSIAGTIGEAGVTANLVVTGGGFYVQGQSFFAHFGGSAAAAAVGNSWVKLPAALASQVESEFSAFSHTSSLASCLDAAKNVSLSKTTTTVGGQSVIQLKGGGTTLDVQNSSRPFPVQLSSNGTSTTTSSNACGGSSGSSSSSEPGTLAFDSWGSVATITPPPNPLDLSSSAP